MNTTVQDPNSLTVGNVLADARDILEGAGFTDGMFQAQYLLGFILGMTRTQLFLHPEKKISPAANLEFRAMLERRLQHEPLQYIIGRVEFWSREFRVTPDVLIPRQETEFILEQILTAIRKHNFPCRRALDMGTGSGVIADVLADELDCQVVAVDCSLTAIKVARANIEDHGLLDKITFVCSDLFAQLPQGEQFDLIVSNPPYVAESEMHTIQAEIIDYEPSSALFAGSDGLDCYRRLIPESVNYLRPGGWLCLEIGADQGPAVQKILCENGYQNVTVFPDYAGRPRLVTAVKQHL